MSQSVRSLSSRLITCVNSRKRLMQVGRRLPKHAKQCASFPKYGTLPVSPAKVEETQLQLLTNRFIVGNHGNHLRAYATTATNPKESVVVQNYEQSTNSPRGQDGSKGPTLEQLQAVCKGLQDDLPKIFVASQDYSIYHRDVEFVNNLRGTRTKGLTQYIKQILYMRMSAHILYAYVKLDMLKITVHPEDNSIKVRWRIRGLSGLKVFATFWKLNVLKLSESLKSLETWHDGFSTFSVGSDGLIYRHVAEKMMPDDETIPAKEKNNIAAKLAA